MKISLNWAQHWCSTPAYTPKDLDAFAHTYSTYTAEVEGIDSYIFDNKIVIGKVLAWNPHPDSEKLGLVDIDAGAQGRHTIVCGAENAKIAHYVPVALENATLPGGLVISRRSIRGIDSCGMICSLDELELSSVRAEGIFCLETVWPEELLERNIGKPFGELVLDLPGYIKNITYPLNDVVFDLDNKFITNRPDLFSIVGNAREIACIQKSTFTSPLLSPSLISSGANPSVTIETKKVSNYILTSCSLGSTPETPLILQILLKRSSQGLHGILPDLTNIVMTELGQPMHVFDADMVVGNITVRMAKKGETIEALDGKTYTLDADVMVIADEKNILAIAGVIGGQHSGTTESTKNILIESATFDPISVRKTSQRLGIRTDSSVRFEKGVDPTLPKLATDRYLQLLNTYVANVGVRGTFTYSTLTTPTQLSVSHDFIVNRIGTEISEETITGILTRLGFTVTVNFGIYTVTVPSWRDTGDIDMPSDIVEEVARMVGYESLPVSHLPGPILTTKNHAHDSVTAKISQFFALEGYFDVYTYPFTLAEKFKLFTDKDPAIIHNTSENRTHLRSHLIDSLLDLVASSYRKHTQGKYFEFGSIFDGDESLQGLGVMWGYTLPELQETLGRYVKTFFGIDGEIVQSTQASTLFAPHACGEIIDTNNRVLIKFGLIRPTLLPHFDISHLDIYAFEIITLPDIHRPIQFTPIHEYPGTTREFNIIMSEETPVKIVLDIVGNSHEWISNIGVSEIYRDPIHIGVNKKSVIVSLLMQNPDATITDEEALAIQKMIILNLVGKGYEIRGA